MAEHVMTINEIRTIVSPIAEKYHIPAIYLFGSYARGTANPNSDIDLIIDTAGTQLTGMFALGMLYSDLETALSKKTDIITLGSLSQKTTMASEIGFRETVLKECIRLTVPFQDRVETAQSLFGVIPSDLSPEQSKDERMNEI